MFEMETREKGKVSRESQVCVLYIMAPGMHCGVTGTNEMHTESESERGVK